MNEYDIISKFEDSPFFTKKELFDFLNKRKNELSDSYYRLLLSKLRTKGILEDIKKNIYTIKVKPIFQPVIEKKLKKIVKDVQKHTLDLDYVCWESLWLNRFIIHQSNTSMLIFECEKEHIESIYHILKDNNYENVYLNPKKDVIDTYLAENKNSIIVKPLISRSPSFEIEGIKIPAIEKILVDVFSDQNLFYAYQGKELMNLFNNSIDDFKLNFSTLFNYAKRRNKYNDLLEFIKNLSIINKQILIGETYND